jgi:hypothetical protein
MPRPLTPQAGRLSALRVVAAFVVGGGAWAILTRAVGGTPAGPDSSGGPNAILRRPWLASRILGQSRRAPAARDMPNDRRVGVGPQLQQRPEGHDQELHLDAVRGRLRRQRCHDHSSAYQAWRAHGRSPDPHESRCSRKTGQFALRTVGRRVQRQCRPRPHNRVAGLARWRHLAQRWRDRLPGSEPHRHDLGIFPPPGWGVARRPDSAQHERPRRRGGWHTATLT